jgi:predicted acylesterase/phospholipase RssA
VGLLGSFTTGLPLPATQAVVSWFSQWLTPAQVNPLGVNPLRRLLLDQVDFDLLDSVHAMKVFVCATNVRTGGGEVFSGKRLTVDAVMASACLPTLFKPVEIAGELYWDGGYSGNPALYPLIYNTRSNDMVLVQINPVAVPFKADADAQDIMERVNEITFNAPLLAEFRAIEFVARLLDEGRLDPPLPQDAAAPRRWRRGAARPSARPARCAPTSSFCTACSRSAARRASTGSRRTFATWACAAPPSSPDRQERRTRMSNAGPHHDPDCIFCKIVAGQIPSRKVYEDEELFAFHDIAPWAPVHFLIMPKAHILSMAHTGAEHERLLGRMMALAPRWRWSRAATPTRRRLPHRRQHRRRGRAGSAPPAHARHRRAAPLAQGLMQPSPRPAV